MKGGILIQQPYELNSTLTANNPYIPEDIIQYGYDLSGSLRINNIAKIGPGFWNDLPAMFNGTNTGIVPVFLNNTTNPSIVSVASGGVIEILDWQADFNGLIPGQFVTANIAVKFGSDWYDRTGIVPEQTRDANGLLLTTKWTLLEPTNPDKILVRLL